MKKLLQPPPASARLIFLVVCCVALSVIASPQDATRRAGDFLRIRNVQPPPQNTLVAGRPAPITVFFDYGLSSADRAIFAVFAEEFPESAGGCRGDQHQTNGGNQFLAQRGEAAGSTIVTWRGNAPTYPRGYVTVGANLWTADMKRQIASFGLYSQVCYQFIPQGKQYNY